MPVKTLALAGLICLSPTLAFAQAVAAAPQATSAEQIDTSALAYYAAKHDTPRFDAEMRRLHSLYPNWTPPSDPAALASAPEGVSNDQPLWDLFGADKIDELDAEISRHKAADPAWMPPSELAAKLATKRARAAAVDASNRKDYPAVVDIVAKTPALLTTDDLDLSWRAADAYGQTGASDKALKVDQLILDRSQDPAVRLATVRKAMISLAPTDLDKLMLAGHTQPDGRSEFDAVSLDLARQRVGRVLAASATDAAAPQDIAHLESSAQGPSGAVDAALLGWWYSKRLEWSRASTWFQVALKVAPLPAQAKPDDAKVAQGAVLALKASGKQADAEALAYRWRDVDPALALLYIDSVQADLTRPKPVALAEDRLRQFSDVVVGQQSGNGAQSLGWYAYNIGQFRPAEAWFRKAMTWQPRDSTALGVALSLKQLGDKPALVSFVKENAATFPALAALSTNAQAVKSSVLVVRPQRVTASSGRAEPARRPRTADDQTLDREIRHSSKAECAAAPSYSSDDSAAALRAGWCLMFLDRSQEAAMAFEAARRGAATRVDAAYGQALAALRAKRTDVAVMAASSIELTTTRRNEIGLAALAQTATAAFDQGRYKDTLRALDQRRLYTVETRDLAILRAWSTYHTDRREEAQTMFSALDTQLSTSETRAGMAATTQPSRY